MRLNCYSWYVLYTKSCQELKAEEYLKGRGIEVFLPKTGKFRQWSDRKKWIERPLFPSYIFIRVSLKEYAIALHHSSIVRYITIGGNPCRIPDEQIEAIKTILQHQLEFEITTDNFEPGDSVVFCEGPLTGYSAEIVQLKGVREVILRIKGTPQSLLIKTKFNLIKKSFSTYPIVE